MWVSKNYDKDMPSIRKFISDERPAAEGNLEVKNAEFPNFDNYVSKKELGPCPASVITKEDTLSPRMGEGIIQYGMKVSPTKRGEKKFEPPNFKLAKTRAALMELKTTA